MTLYQRSDAGMLRTAWELSAGLLSFVVAIVLGWWCGRTLDAWAGTSPWFTLVFSGFGLAAGVLNVYRTMRRALMETGRGGQPAAAKRSDRSGAND